MTARKLASGLDANGKPITNLPVPQAGSSDAARMIDLEAIREFARSRANHLGTQPVSTIEGFDAAVRLNRLDQMAVPTTPVSANSQRITNLADGTAAQDAITLSQLENRIQGLTSEQTTKGAVKVVVGTNVTIANPGTSTLDGVSLVNGDIVLLAAQTTGSQNGPYRFNGSGVAMTRAANWDTPTEAVVGSYWLAAQGTQADKFVLMTNDTFVLGTDTATFQYVGMAAAQTPSVEQDLGDGSATVFTITHNFNTRRVLVVVYRNASPYDEPTVYVSHATLNTVTIEPDEVWVTNQYHAVVTKLP